MLIDAIVEKYCTPDRKMCQEVDGCGAILPAANISGFYAQWHAEKSQSIWKALVCLQNIFTGDGIGMYNYPRGSTERKFSPLVAQTACQDFTSIFA